ncbi:Hpt domain-containing protein [Mesorhizobium sp. RP14(2022)]|uniref:Hpt domain-containing protein n=1 Tax=Mesorhizobium liriopis TaxID=2953882 RepID=A0ABT1CB95_9HYPH|nr:Hpt domain-containing protein [Mesorhizobium liriopis]MCO6052097.1 Hpt domain-containing protein [Mesorhizobium liriopis]
MSGGQPDSSKQNQGAAGRVLDLDHLARQTFDDRALEAEVLTAFIQQAELFGKRLAEPNESLPGELAHTIKGSARAVGAWGLAELAERYENAESEPDRAKLVAAIFEADGAARARLRDLS